MSSPEEVPKEVHVPEELSEELSESEETSEELSEYEEMYEDIYEESSKSEETSEESSGPEDIAEGHFDDLNCLIETGDQEAVKTYIKENQIKPVAICRGFQSCIRYDFGRRCPVALAAKCGHVQVMKVLIDAGFPVDERSEDFRTISPIHIACERGHLEVVKTLVEEYNVDITHGDNCEKRPAMCIVADNGYLEIVQYFTEKAEIPVNSRYGEMKESALHAAAENNQLEVCKYLIAKGADINICDAKNSTPLMLAAQNASYNIARFLLDATGADANFSDNEQATAFLYAAEQCDLKMMKLLQSYGADPELYDKYSTSPLFTAVSGGRRDIVFYLVNELNVRIKPFDFYEATWQGECRIALITHRYDMVKHLFNVGYDPSKELAEYEDSDKDNSSTESSEDSDSMSPRKKRKSFPLQRYKVKLRELRQMIARPRSLLALSVLTVRRLLGRRLPVDLDSLPLPDILKNLIVSCGEEKP